MKTHWKKRCICDKNWSVLVFPPNRLCPRFKCGVLRWLGIKTWGHYGLLFALYSLEGTDPDFQLETSTFPKIFIKILEEINYGKEDGNKHKRRYSVGGRGLHKKISVHKFIRWIDLLSQVIQCFQKANYLTDATNRLWGNSYIYTPWAVVTTKIHKATEHSRHLRLPKVLWILTDNTERSHCTYSQLGEGTTTPPTPTCHRWL